MQNGEIKEVLDYWFSDTDLDSPTLDSRMDRWFGSSEALDNEIEERFGDLVERASGDELDAWSEQPEGRLALIILLDQFRRNIFRGKPEAFEQDKKALKI